MQTKKWVNNNQHYRNLFELFLVFQSLRYLFKDMTTNVKSRCNWTQIGGNSFDKAVPTRWCTDEDIFVKPELNDILNEDSALLFSRPSDFTEACELQMQIFPRFKIAAVSLICSASKVELFLGSHREYIETVYGETAESVEEDDHEIENIPKPYRYDIEIERSGVVDISLKMVTSNDEICIFGIILHIAPNPNGITTLLPRSVNLENVQEILKGSSQKLSANAEKCKQFMEMYKQSSSSPNNYSVGLNPEKSLETSIGLECNDDMIKAHIDTKLEELERTLMIRLDAFEAQQSIKLDKIIKLLENKI